MRRLRYLLAFCVAGCGPLPTPTSPSDSVSTPPVTEPQAAQPWVPEYEPARNLGASCSLAVSAVSAAGLSEQWAGLRMMADTTDATLPIYEDLRADPGQGACLLDALSEALSPDGGQAVSSALRVATQVLGSPVASTYSAAESVGFEVAVDRLCGVAGQCEQRPSSPSPQLQSVLTPLLVVLADALLAQQQQFQEDARGEAWWRTHGGHLILMGQQRPNPSYGPDAARLRADRRRLYANATRVAEAVEQLSWPEGLDETYTLVSSAGRVVVHGRGDDVHVDGDVLLSIDLGGDDRYLGASTTAVNVHIDLGGRDIYAYPGAEQTQASAELPDDGGGRGDVQGLIAQASLSEAPRQGAARGGISLLFDLGPDSDRYVTLRGGQGYAQQGVGVLFDAGGDDVYIAEAGAQGSAQMGIGLLIDVGGGNDQRQALYASQGFGGPGGFGALIDDGGDDVYQCAAAPVLYPSPQLEASNANFCQGAGLGFRAHNHAESWPGGLGLLLDHQGDDTYEVGVFGQGVGYWKGTGLLIDAAGDDLHEHLWYAAGAAAHFGVGILLQDGAGADTYGLPEQPAHMSQGAAHHFGLGALFERGGSDLYYLPTMGAGAASCASVGLFVDDWGNDRYEAQHSAALGVTALGTCEERGEALTRAVFIDASGQDSYAASVAEAAEAGRWGTTLDAHPSQLALGIDLETQPQ